MTDRPSPAWWQEAFGAEYRLVYAARSDEAAAREAAFVFTALGAREGERLLDCGCGGGRHARAFAARGLRVVGVDRSADLLAAARSAGAGPAYVRADLRALPFRAAFDHAVSLFTSFGYFEGDGDARQLRAMRRALRPGGRFLLDFLNAPRVAADLVPESERETGGAVVRESRVIRGGRVEKTVEVERGGAVTARWRESVRLYERPELEAMLRSADLAVDAAYGDLQGGPWSPVASRLVLRAVAR